MYAVKSFTTLSLSLSFTISLSLYRQYINEIRHVHACMGERDKERESAGVCRQCARTLSLHHALSSPISLSLSRKLSLKCQHAATCSPRHTKTASQTSSVQNVPDLRMSHAMDFVDLVRTVTVPVPFPIPSVSPSLSLSLSVTAPPNPRGCRLLAAAKSSTKPKSRGPSKGCIAPRNAPAL